MHTDRSQRIGIGNPCLSSGRPERQRGQGVFIRGCLIALLGCVSPVLAGGVIKGRVTGANGKPAAGVSLQLIHAATKASATAISGEDGLYASEELEIGAWFVQTSGTDERYLGRKGIMVREGETTTGVDLRVGSLTLRGVVKETSGAPLPGAFITAKRLDFAPDEFLPTVAAISATAAEDGSFVVPQLFPGTYSITVAGPGRGMVLMTNYSLMADAELPVTFVDSCRISGTIVDEEGEPLEGVGIQVFRVAPPPVIRSYSLTDEEGVYTVLNVGPGLYEVIALGSGRVPSVLKGVVVEADSTSTNNNFTLKSGAGGKITGIVTYGSRPLPVVVIARSVDSCLESMTRADERGEYLFEFLPAGDYLLSFSDPTAGDVRVTVKDGETVTRDFSYYGE